MIDKYIKNFDRWNMEKKYIEHQSHKIALFHEREIWWCSIGINIGDEEDGKNSLFERPVLIIRKFSNKIAWVLPMSTNNKIGIHYYTFENNNIRSSILLSQMRILSAKRFRRFMKKISTYEFAMITGRLIDLLRYRQFQSPP